MSETGGTAREMAGRVQQRVGEVAGDAKTQAEFTTRRLARRSSKLRA
jgi:uncharacterized protein YjbJ (UPF0337 family)